MQTTVVKCEGSGKPVEAVTEEIRQNRKARCEICGKEVRVKLVTQPGGMEYKLCLIGHVYSKPVFDSSQTKFPFDLGSAAQSPAFEIEPDPMELRAIEAMESIARSLKLMALRFEPVMSAAASAPLPKPPAPMPPPPPLPQRAPVAAPAPSPAPAPPPVKKPSPYAGTALDDAPAAKKNAEKDSNDALERAFQMLLEARYSPKTARKYRQIWLRFSEWCESHGIDPAEASRTDAARYLKRKVHEAPTRNAVAQFLFALRAVSRALVEVKAIKVSAFESVKLPYRRGTKPKQPRKQRRMKQPVKPMPSQIEAKAKG